MNSASQLGELRPATEADLPAIQRVIAAAYDKYLSRMDKPPAPLLRDYGPAVGTGAVWVTGNPVIGLISLTPVGDAILIENVAVHPDQQGSGLGRLQAIYAHLGYQVTSRRAENGYRRIYMEKTLPASECDSGGARPRN